MSRIHEKYSRLGEDERAFDVEFWQAQGEAAIFDAVYQMLIDYLILKGRDVNESRLQRTVESFKRE